MSSNNKRENWGSSLGFILAAAGSAVGLGNIWKFPYITGENGGGAFVLVYLLCIAVVGLPVMLCEITLGRKTQRNPVGAFKQLCPDSSTVAHLLGAGLSLTGIFLLAFERWGWGVVAIILGLGIFKWSWKIVGGMGVVAGFIILSFYSVIAGWTIGYMADIAGKKIDFKELKTAANGEEIMNDHMLSRTNVVEDGFSTADGSVKGATISGLPAAALSQAWKTQQENLNQQKWEALLSGTYSPRPFTISNFDLDGTYKIGDGIFTGGQAASAEKTSVDLTGKTVQAGTITQGMLVSGKVTDIQSGTVECAVISDLNASDMLVSMHFPWWSVIFHTIFMACCIGTVLFGVQNGIERASKILMPLLIVLLAALILRGVTLPGASKGVRFLLSPDFSKLTAEGILIALGHAFFSLSLGMGAMITYGSYARKQDNVFLSSLSIVFLDTLVALLAGLAIFPAVFAEKFDPSAGPGLIFVLLPQVFAKIPLGIFWCFIFFLLIFVAALTSGISLQEVVTAYFIDEKGWSRKTATLVFGGVIWLLGCFSAVSFYGWGRLFWLKRFFLFVFDSSRSSFFDIMDNLASNWMLPLGGLFISLFVGWIWGTKKAVDEIRHGSHNFADVHVFSLLAGLKDDHSHNSDVHVLTLASIWGFFIRFISPVAVLIAFLSAIGWLEFHSKQEAPEPKPQVVEKVVGTTSPVIDGEAAK